jgi:hypothetical protein
MILFFHFIRKNYNAYNGDYKGELMFKNLISKVFNKENNQNETVLNDEVTLKALCAYRDNLILSPVCIWDEVEAVEEEIDKVWNRMPVRS